MMKNKIAIPSKRIMYTGLKPAFKVAASCQVSSTSIRCVW